MVLCCRSSARELEGLGSEGYTGQWKRRKPRNARLSGKANQRLKITAKRLFLLR